VYSGNFSYKSNYKLSLHIYCLYRCYNVDGTERVYSDLSIICFKGSHFFWAFFVALPSIIVWGVGIPFFAYALLAREKNKLKTLELREKFGFLYTGYKK
jgi:hypothetical protein